MGLGAVPLLEFPGEGEDRQAAERHDAERGVLLRSAARTKGEKFQVTEVLEIAFDEELSEDIFVADDVFQAEPPPGT